MAVNQALLWIFLLLFPTVTGNYTKWETSKWNTDLGDIIICQSILDSVMYFTPSFKTKILFYWEFPIGKLLILYFLYTSRHVIFTTFWQLFSKLFLICTNIFLVVIEYYWEFYCLSYRFKVSSGIIFLIKIFNIFTITSF